MSNVKSKFYHKKVELKNQEGFSGEWFLFRIIPLPSKEEIENVISDIILNREIGYMKDLSLCHDFNCKEEHLKLDDRLLRAIKQLKPIEYKIAIKERHYNIQGQKELEGQPVVIAIEPEISYDVYCNHPHLNRQIMNELPVSICYTNDFSSSSLGDTPSERIDNAIIQVSQWLLRHQVWEAYYSMFKEQLWIGPFDHHQDIEPKKYWLRNPNGKCRCGSGLVYSDCCLEKDYKITKIKSQPFLNADNISFDIHLLSEKILKNYTLPNMILTKKFRDILIKYF